MSGHFRLGYIVCLEEEIYGCGETIEVIYNKRLNTPPPAIHLDAMLTPGFCISILPLHSGIIIDLILIYKTLY